MHIDEVDQIEQDHQTEQEEIITTENFICPNCGGTMKFDIKKQAFVCQSCQSEGDIETEQTEVKEYDFNTYRVREKNSTITDTMAVAICATCGAEVLFEATETATVCPMCGSSQVSESRQNSGIPPEGVIPFKIEKQEAQEKFKKWIKSRWFAPNKLKQTYGEGNLTGLYIPFWTYDTDAAAHYTGQGGTHYHETDEDGKTVTKTRWTHVSGYVEEFFDDIQICASKNSESGIIENILPYNTINNTIPFSMEYLSGFKAERYSIKADEGFEKAKAKVESVLHSRAASDIRRKGYDEASSIRLNVHYRDVTYKHVLLPVWSSVFGYSGKTYRYIINGETGKVSGQRPYSAPKIIAAIIAVILAILAFNYFKSEGESEAAKAEQFVPQVQCEQIMEEASYTGYEKIQF